MAIRGEEQHLAGTGTLGENEAPDGPWCTVWDRIAAPLILVDADSVVLAANPPAGPWLATVGVSVGDRLSESPAAWYLSDGNTPVPYASRPLARALAGSVVAAEEYVVRWAGPTSSSRRYLITAYPVRGEAGDPSALLTCQEVGPGVEGAQRWREATERLSWLLEGATDYAIFMLDPLGQVQTWSSSAHRLLGRSEQEVLGQGHEIFFVPPDRAAGLPQRQLERARTSGRAEGEGLRRRADGSQFWAREVLTAVRGPDDELLAYVSLTHDTSAEHAAQKEVCLLNQQLRELNEDLERRIQRRTEQLQRKADELGAVNRELEAFSYSVSHDLRAPLRAMSGFARLLDEEYHDGLDAQALHYLQRIVASARQMGHLIDDLLAFSRVLQQQMATQSLDMNAMVREAWQSVRLPDSPVHLELAELPPARGDRLLVMQVWMNLLGNADKFSRRSEDPVVRVFAEPVGSVTKYHVVDNGVGFDMRFAGKLFRPFQRLHRADDFAGNGIGLALVDRIIRRHGGSLGVSAAENAGASFWFTLEPPTSTDDPVREVR